MIFSAIASFYQMIFSFTCQFSQKSDFHVIFDGDDSSLPIADTDTKGMSFPHDCA